MSSLPFQPKKCLIFWDFPMKNVVKIFGIPMSSLGGVHLISGIAHSCEVEHGREGNGIWLSMLFYSCVLITHYPGGVLTVSKCQTFIGIGREFLLQILFRKLQSTVMTLNKKTMNQLNGASSNVTPKIFVRSHIGQMERGRAVFKLFKLIDYEAHLHNVPYSFYWMGQPMKPMGQVSSQKLAENLVSITNLTSKCSW